MYTVTACEALTHAIAGAEILQEGGGKGGGGGGCPRAA